MFYSQTFLARKGPLGTVWCAAHLQHRLKKSHYTSTDISSTVDRIMFPEVPIALRMSGHLLLGVVRIYSKKVDYLFQDCNVVLNVLRKAFASIDLNLPEDARQAPVQSITLPDKFDLDTLELDDEMYNDGSPDNHLRSQEEITLTDQIPIGRDPYIAISFDEDIVMMDLPYPQVVPYSDVRPMEEDIPMQPAISGNEDFPHPDARLSDDQTPRKFPHDVAFRDSGLSNQTEMLDIHDNIPQDLPEREIMRDAVHDLGLEQLPPVFPDRGDEIGETNRSLKQITNEKDTLSPILDDNLASGGQSLPFQQHTEPPPSAASLGSAEIFDMPVSFSVARDLSPGLGIIRSTPPVQQPKARKRKRKQLFDESTVLTNKFMKKTLEDTSDLLRKKRDVPCSALGMWKSKNSLKKDQVFHQPLLTGLCMDLFNISKNEYMTSKPHLVLSEETFTDPRVPASPASAKEALPEPRVAESPAASTEVVPEFRVAQSPPPMPELDIEIERPRDAEHFDGSSFLPEFVPSQAGFTPSPLRRCDFTPATTMETQLLPTPDLAVSTGTCTSEFKRSVAFSEERLGLENTGLSDIPSLMHSAEADDLHFLEADNNTPTGSQATGGVDSLSVRTRAVAQYLKRHSPFSPTLEALSGDLTLNKTLEGRTRKLCARMFFEILFLFFHSILDNIRHKLPANANGLNASRGDLCKLCNEISLNNVLKSYGLVDVQQEVPYDDISLKLTPTLSKVGI